MYGFIIKGCKLTSRYLDYRSFKNCLGDIVNTICDIYHERITLLKLLNGFPWCKLIIQTGPLAAVDCSADGYFNSYTLRFSEYWLSLKSTLFYLAFKILTSLFFYVSKNYRPQS